MAIKFLNTATAATQAVGDNSTKIATTAYADAAASAIPIGNYLPLSAGASKPLTGPLYIPHYIYHVGDAGTFIGFPANDRLIIGTNGGTRVDITNSGFCLGDSGSNISVSTILDENDMASDSATALVTQQSIKAYVDGLADDDITALAFTGTTTQTLTATQRDSTTLTASFNIAKTQAGGTGPSAENLNTVGNNVTVGQMEYRGFNSSSSNAPPTSDNANGVISVGQHSGNYGAQLAFSSNGNMYWRDNPSTGFGSWRTMWDSGNDGAGSGLDADLLDGQQGSYYATAASLGDYLPLAGGTMNTNATITMSGNLTTSANVYAQRWYDQGNNAFYGDFAGTSQFNHVKVNSVLGTRNFVAGSYGWQLEQSSTTGSPVTFRFDNQKYRIYAGGGVGEIMTFLEGGNIGIGTVSPGAKLNVAGDVLIDSGEYISWGTVGATSIEGSTASNKLQFRTSSTDRMIINDTGVGIGTTTPLNKTHIVGPTLATGTETSYGLAVSDVGDETKTLILGYDLVNDVGIIQAIDQQTAWKDLALGISGDTKVGVGEIAPTAKLHIKSPGNATLIRAYSAGYKAMDLWGATNGSQLTLHGGAEAATIVLDGRPGYNSYFTTGNVGIGTTTPDQKLHIKGGDIQTQDTTGSNGVLRIRATITGTPSTGGYPNVGAGDAVIEGGGTTQRRAGVITLMNGDSSISAGQDLGVIQFVGKDDASNGYCTSQIISTTSSAAGTGASGGGILRFLTASGNTGSAVEERMRINNSGRVMIGTTTATSNANLTVKDSLAIQNGSNTVLSIFTGYGSSFINTGTSGGTVNFGAPTSYTTNVYVQGTIKAASSVQMGNNTAAASSANAGSTRYRVSGNNSYMDMSMRTGSTTYAWVNIVQNNW